MSLLLCSLVALCFKIKITIKALFILNFKYLKHRATENTREDSFFGVQIVYLKLKAKDSNQSPELINKIFYKILLGAKSAAKTVNLHIFFTRKERGFIILLF